jgi:hypothetical protein
LPRLNFKYVHFRKALESKLAQVGTDANRPVFSPDGDMVVISTPAELKAVADSARAMARADISPALRAKLDRRLPEVKFDGVGLSDVLDFLRNVSGLPLTVDWKGLGDAGVGHDDPVTARFDYLGTGQVLRLILVSMNSNKRSD